MLTAIISDVHSNLPALEAVLETIKKLKCQKIISLGDVVGYHCFHNECIQIFRRENIINLMGNHDMYLSQGTRCARSNSVNKILDFQSKTISSDNLNWLRSSPKVLYTSTASFLHGGRHDLVDEYISEPTEDYFAGITTQFFFSGHTHVQTLRQFTSLTYCNPGSVGQPRDGDSRASFAVFDGKNIELHKTYYDIDLVAQKMKDLNFTSYFYQGLYQGYGLRPSNTPNKPE